MDFSRFTHLTFDCYGTLIDWETGILDAVHGLLQEHGVTAEDADVLRAYVASEARSEAGPYRPYREVLAQAMADIGAGYGLELDADTCAAFAASLPTWPPFADTVAALARLKTRYRLAVISNVDDDLFAGTAAALGNPFDSVITAQQLGSYKPARRNFTLALERLGVDRTQVLHVAQSLYHDHVPAKELGWATVWIDRPSRLRGTGLAPPADVTPDLTLHDLASFAALAAPDAAGR